MNYGVWYKQSLNHSLQSYRNQAGVGYLRQREDIINVYMGLGKSWNNKFILDASLSFTTMASMEHISHTEHDIRSHPKQYMGYGFLYKSNLS